MQTKTIFMFMVDFLWWFLQGFSMVFSDDPPTSLRPHLGFVHIPQCVPLSMPGVRLAGSRVEANLLLVRLVWCMTKSLFF